ncbi:MAG: A/G-specific adenine glycosylase [Salinivirgaceae bacterium]|jgi:A/G-specific adenine glycosylase|nr:A/G-specific adenine glycosylase [Salinivirgaceae bacterium]
MDISKTLTDWYNTNARDLPWRNTSDPYAIWVSEIIMQQTRIDQGLPYYLKFLDHFPSVHDLAKASEEKVLLVWQGLGYYSRARNMHHTAKEIVLKFQGNFPTSAAELIKLKGIGKYTAAAISSICFGENIAAIDGNVIRVIARLFNIKEAVNKLPTLKTIDAISQKLIKNIDASIYNQALMDLGAIICTPKKVNCNACPLINMCEAYSKRSVDSIPLKEKKTSIKNRYFVYIIIQSNNKLLINKREENDIWKGIYEFPLIVFKKKATLKQILNHVKFKTLVNNKFDIMVNHFSVSPHILSHQTIHTTFIKCTIAAIEDTSQFTQINISDLAEYAFPQLIHKHISTIFNKNLQ